MKIKYPEEITPVSISIRGYSASTVSYRTESFVSDKAKDYINDLLGKNNHNISGDRKGKFNFNTENTSESESLNRAMINAKACTGAVKDYIDTGKKFKDKANAEKEKLNSIAL